MNSLPNLFLVGAAKAGTTTISQFFKLSNEIYTPLIKEPNYFSFDIDETKFKNDYFKQTCYTSPRVNYREIKEKHIAFVKNKEDYFKLYSLGVEPFTTNHQYFADCSTSYLFSENAAINIKNHNPESKIIICLRNPYQRAVSHFNMDIIQKRHIPMIFSKALENELKVKERLWGREHLYIDLGLYSDQVERYLNIFKDNVLILFFEELQLNPLIFFKKITDFLGLDQQQNEQEFTQQIHNNKSLGYKIPSFINNIVRQLPSSIKSFFKNNAPDALIKKPDADMIDNESIRILNRFYSKDLKELQKKLDVLNLNIPESFYYIPSREK